MKKVLSLVLSLIAVFSVSAAFAVPALADVNSPSGTTIVTTEKSDSNGESKSPNTGAASASGVAVAFAGLAVAGVAVSLIAKKKDAE
ncbi:MAG: hypothetical protein LIO43_06300 [Clostridiales bacterium]|nr:hypothetical protein [Clostridiales bacterium]MCD7872349.1 hypothetical protein [Clostridiales bacterium]